MPTSFALARRGSLVAALGLVLLQNPVPHPLYTPRSIAAAYRKGTRSPDGRPGPKYWQNHGRYAMTITAAPPDRTVRGSEQITYWNESPNPLSTLVFKFFLDNHRPGAPRNSGASDAYLSSGVQVDAFGVNGQTRPWTDDPGAYTVRRVHLPAMLAPHDSVRLSFDWHYEISRESHREGMIDSTTYFLAYFYPRVAVYDDTDGWDTMDFTEEQEFYSDFNDYDVTVRVPANYLVWGTGTLLNPSEVLLPEYANRLQASLGSDQTIQVATAAELAAKTVTQPAAGQRLALHRAERAGRELCLERPLRLGRRQRGGGRRHPAAGVGAGRLQRQVQRFPPDGGLRSPRAGLAVAPVAGGAVSVREDHGGPGVRGDGIPDDGQRRELSGHHLLTVRGGARDRPHLVPVLHRHQRDPLRLHGRGLGHHVRIPDRAGRPRRRPGGQLLQAVPGERLEPGSLPGEDLPIITPGDLLKGAGLGNNEYGKPALGYLASKELLGDSLFRTGLHAFIERWHGKHPIPWDFFNTMNDATGRNLNWFWENWFFSNNYIDLAVDPPVKAKTGFTVAVRNVGGMAAPFDLVIRYADSTTTRTHYSPAVWQANPRATRLTVRTKQAIGSVTVDGGIWVDADGTNNTWAKR